MAQESSHQRKEQKPTKEFRGKPPKSSVVCKAWFENVGERKQQHGSDERDRVGIEKDREPRSQHSTHDDVANHEHGTAERQGVTEHRHRLVALL